MKTINKPFFSTQIVKLLSKQLKNYAKNEKYQPYLAEYQQLEKNFPLLLIEWLPESQTKRPICLHGKHYKNFIPIKVALFT